MLKIVVGENVQFAWGQKWWRLWMVVVLRAREAAIKALSRLLSLGLFGFTIRPYHCSSSVSRVQGLNESDENHSRWI